MPQNRLTALKITGIYAVVGCLWILFSDNLVAGFFSDIPTILRISTFKGWVYVGITSWMLYVLIQRDLRLITQSEEALKSSLAKIKDEKAKSEAMLDAIGDGICIIDKDFIIDYQNKAHINSLGHHTGEHCYNAYAGRDCICEGCLVSLAFSDGGTHSAERCYPADGGVRYFETAASPLTDAAGNIVGGIEIVRDITLRKKIESDVLRTKRLESIGVLARGLSHDFNNLLTGILGNVSLAKASLKPDDPAFAFLTKAESACVRAEHLTNQLNTVAKSDESAKKTISIAGLIREASEFAVSGSQVECVYNIPDDIWTVTVNEEQINQAIYNIVANSRDAMNGSGRITISAENAIVGVNSTDAVRHGNYVKITIEDEGEGIEREMLPKIFDLYFTTKKLGSSKATGFGLAASYFAVKNHRGYIFADSTVGKGTIFSIYLPAA
ncbi:MAG: PAS domain-containing protein [Nitrospirae bacterium]|nr:PAS domain-containing protein [Nitrospirota bacterium]